MERLAGNHLHLPLLPPLAVLIYRDGKEGERWKSQHQSPNIRKYTKKKRTERETNQSQCVHWKAEIAPCLYLSVASSARLSGFD